MIVPVILAGGSGSRLWPLSRSAYPKQLLPLVSGQTMLQDTIARSKMVGNTVEPIVIISMRIRVESRIKNLDKKLPNFSNYFLCFGHLTHLIEINL